MEGTQAAGHGWGDDDVAVAKPLIKYQRPRITDSRATILLRDILRFQTPQCDLSDKPRV